MRALYSSLLYLLSPLLLVVVAAKGGWRSLGQRLGFVPAQSVDCWLHAASVGEVQAAQPLIQALLQRGSVLVSTNSATGAERVRALFGTRVSQAFAPLDLPGTVRRFLRRVRPRRVVVMETELWPNRFRALCAAGIPLLIVNARLSPRSVQGYRRLRPLIAGTLADCSHIAAQTEVDAERFRALGAPPERVSVSGNLKFELTPPAAQIERGRALRQSLGAQRPVWIAASTREGEEEQVLDAHRQVLQARPEALLILVPRHPQRFDEVARLIEKSGLAVIRRSQLDSPSPDSRPPSPVVLGDSMGEMFTYYAASDLAFVGGSLAPLGAQNVLEPAALGLPVLFGPSTYNFAEPCRLLLEAGAARQVADAAGLSSGVLELLRDPAATAAMGQRGRVAIAQHRGALARTLARIEAAGG